MLCLDRLTLLRFLGGPTGKMSFFSFFLFVRLNIAAAFLGVSAPAGERDPTFSFSYSSSSVGNTAYRCGEERRKGKETNPLFVCFSPGGE